MSNPDAGCLNFGLADFFKGEVLHHAQCFFHIEN